MAVNDLDELLSLADVKGLAKRKGIVVGKKAKRELCEELAEGGVGVRRWWIK